MEKSIKYPDLQSLTKGSSFKHVFDFLYKAAQLRYTTYSILNTISSKLGTPKKLNKFVEIEYLVRNPGGIFTVSEKSLQLLQDEGYACKILKPADGEGNPHNRKLAEAVLKLMAEPNFYAVFYPHFTDLIPDACLIQKRQHEYKIIFLEIELEKENWPQYLEDKKKKYNELACDVNLYEKWWKHWLTILDLPVCRLDDFCFSILVISSQLLSFNWEGWTWHQEDGK